MAETDIVVIPFAVTVWNENMDAGEDEQGNEVLVPDGPPSQDLDSCHRTREGAEAAAERARLAGWTGVTVETDKRIEQWELRYHPLQD